MHSYTYPRSFNQWLLKYMIIKNNKSKNIVLIFTQSFCKQTSGQSEDHFLETELEEQSLPTDRVGVMSHPPLRKTQGCLTTIPYITVLLLLLLVLLLLLLLLLPPLLLLVLLLLLLVVLLLLLLLLYYYYYYY